MKLFISADIEGTTGICSWRETNSSNRDYDAMAVQMTKEVGAVCEGANESGVSQILVKDAHDTAMNIHAELLPENVQLIRGWTRDPFGMMAGLDAGFDAVAMTGYHAAAGTSGNPLAHTWDVDIELITLNGSIFSEFQMNAYIAAYYRVPVIFISGDRMICDTAKKLIPHITAAAVSEGIGNASKSIHPKRALSLLKAGILQAFEGDRHACIPELPAHFQVEVHFRDHFRAYKSSFYPGARQSGMKSVVFEADDYMEILRFFLFVL
ncbi:MAG: M55 family metallopeptidase [Lachnospiraceae bacterium]